MVQYACVGLCMQVLCVCSLSVTSTVGGNCNPHALLYHANHHERPRTVCRQSTPRAPTAGDVVRAMKEELCAVSAAKLYVVGATGAAEIIVPDEVHIAGPRDHPGALEEVGVNDRGHRIHSKGAMALVPWRICTKDCCGRGNGWNGLHCGAQTQQCSSTARARRNSLPCPRSRC